MWMDSKKKVMVGQSFFTKTKQSSFAKRTQCAASQMIGMKFRGEGMKFRVRPVVNQREEEERRRGRDERGRKRGERISRQIVIGENACAAWKSNCRAAVC